MPIPATKTKTALMRAYYGVVADERMFRGGTEIWECSNTPFPGEEPNISLNLDVVGYRLEVPVETSFADLGEMEKLLVPSEKVRQKWGDFARWMREVHHVAELPEPRVIITFERENYM